MLYNVLQDHVSTFDQPSVGEISLQRGFSIPYGRNYDSFPSFRVVVALRSSRWEGDLTSSHPRMNTVLGVTCLSLLTLLAPRFIFIFL